MELDQSWCQIPRWSSWPTSSRAGRRDVDVKWTHPQSKGMRGMIPIRTSGGKSSGTDFGVNEGRTADNNMTATNDSEELRPKK